MNNGGPAFPVSTRPHEQEVGYGHQDGPSTWQFGGMTLRDYFAAKAMQAYQTDPAAGWGPDAAFHCSQAAYRVADAMIKVREETNE